MESEAPPRRSTTPAGVSQAFVDSRRRRADLHGVVRRPRGVVTALVAGARVTLTAVDAGTATIRVTDPGGLSATQSFTVTVSTTVPGSILHG